MKRFQPSVHSARSNTNYSYPGYTDGKMVRGFLHNLEQDARLMQDVITDDDTLPPWVTWKVYTAEDRLQAAARYMERQAKMSNAKKNPDDDESYASPRNLAVVMGVLFLAGYLNRKRMLAARAAE